MHFERIRTFITVIESNSYGAAAKQMHLSKAAVSKQISLLEEELGIKLIERTTRRLGLTEGGILYYAHLDLVRHRYITHSMRLPDHVLTFGRQHVHLDPYLRINNAQAMLECALNGLGIVKLHDYMAVDSIKSGKLVEILSPFSQEEYAIYLYYMQNRYLSPKIRHFIDFLLAKML